MQFVDTHCHLDYQTYQGDLTEVIHRAEDLGVYRIVVPGLNLRSSSDAINLADRFNSVYSAVGVHPGDVDNFIQSQLSQFEDLLAHPKVMAIGEIGLDNYHRQDNLPEQLSVMAAFFEMAAKHNKPVILHSRNSLHELLQAIEEHNLKNPGNSLRGILHAFEGNIADAHFCTRMGFCLGAGGPVTYKNATIKHEVFSKINLSNIVLETDGPFLSPQPSRGKRNEPSSIPLIAEKIAELQHCDITEVALRTTANAKNLFNWID